MKKSEMINYLTENIKINAYRATICEWLAYLDVDIYMLEYNENMYYGKAFAFLETLAMITGNRDESAYEDAVNEAMNDIKNANYDVVKILDMAGYNGKEYYENNKEETKKCLTTISRVAGHAYTPRLKFSAIPKK